MAAEPAPAGFAEDVVATLPRLRAYARVLRARDPHAADDLVQDTVVLALRAWHRFTPGTNLEGWLFTIERNRFRSLRTRRQVTAEVGVDDLGPLASVPAFQEERAELRRLQGRLRPPVRAPPRGAGAARGPRPALRAGRRGRRLRGRHGQEPDQPRLRHAQGDAARRGGPRRGRPGTAVGAGKGRGRAAGASGRAVTGRALDVLASGPPGARPPLPGGPSPRHPATRTTAPCRTTETPRPSEPVSSSPSRKRTSRARRPSAAPPPPAATAWTGSSTAPIAASPSWRRGGNAWRRPGRVGSAVATDPLPTPGRRDRNRAPRRSLQARRSDTRSRGRLTSTSPTTSWPPAASPSASTAAIQKSGSSTSTRTARLHERPAGC